MYLKEIRMDNFKSFGGKRKIPFLPGFTAVTGPNGSGKSNIGDAILFVLGPKSSRVIRAGKLTDLIFNGGRENKPARQCSVSLVFDNQSRIIPLEEDEVCLQRIVKRSATRPGDYSSTFLVNGRKSTLTEFDMLLSHARISADGYNFVQQGDITRIVSMGNVERRRILDNIAGITRFDADIQHAEKKKLEVEGNLERIQVLMDEIDVQLKQLERDRAAALKYLEHKERLDLAKAQLASKKRDEAEAEVNSVRNQIEKYLEEEKELTARREELKGQLEEVRGELDELEKELAEKGGKEAQQLKEKIDQIRLDRARAKDGIQDTQDQIRELKQERAAVRREIKSAEKQRGQLAADLETVSSELEVVESELKGKEEELKGHEDTMAHSDDKIKQLQKEVLAINQQLEAKYAELREAKLDEDRRAANIQRLDEEIAEAEEKRVLVEAEIKDVEWELKELKQTTKLDTKSVKQIQEDYFEKRNLEAKLAKQSEELESAIMRLNREYTRLEAEAAAAESIRKGYNNAVSKVLQARDRRELTGIHGTIAELADVSEEYETALSVAAGNRMQSIVVDTDGDAAQAIKMLKRSRAGRAAFLPMNKMMEGRPRGKARMVADDPDALGFAIDLVDFREDYHAAFWFVLGDTVVVRNLDAARRLMGGVRMVTLQGELIEASGAMIGGTVERQMLKFGAGAQDEMERVGGELRTALAHSEDVAKKLKALRENLRELEDQLREVSGRSDSESIKLEALETRRKEFRSTFEALESGLEEMRRLLNEQRGGMDRARERQEAIHSEMEAIEAAKRDKGKELMKATPREMAVAMEKLRKAIHEMTNAAANLTSRKDTLKTQINLYDERLGEYNGRDNDLTQRVDADENKVKKLTLDLGKLETEMQALVKIEAGMSSEMAELQGRRDAVVKQRTEMEREVDRISTRLETRGDFVIGLKAKLKAAEEALAEMTKELEAFDVQLEGEMPTMEHLKNVIQECENRMRALEPVNMRAIEDYEAQQRRGAELKEEVGQLHTEKTNLITLVDELVEKKKAGLNKVFTAINENFKRTYEELSCGGEAELILENPESPFEGGLLIKARPKGKKVLRLEALSGGEKGLVSMAFIFAIQQYDPSPFYLLDEIDQNLDAINAGLVSKMVSRDSRNAQFVMVSLRKVSLKEADHIYGVTIQENGVSELLGNVNIASITEKGEILTK